MAGVPWEPDLADVLEASTPSVTASQLNTTHDSQSSVEVASDHSDETVRALLMFSDGFDDDKMSKAGANAENTSDGLRLEQESNYSKCLFGIFNEKGSEVTEEEHDNEKLIAKYVPEETSAISSDTTSGLVENVQIDNHSLDISDQITVVHSTLGQADEQSADIYNINKEVQFSRKDNEIEMNKVTESLDDSQEGSFVNNEDCLTDPMLRTIFESDNSAAVTKTVASESESAIQSIKEKETEGERPKYFEVCTNPSLDTSQGLTDPILRTIYESDNAASATETFALQPENKKVEEQTTVMYECKNQSNLEGIDCLADPILRTIFESSDTSVAATETETVNLEPATDSAKCPHVDAEHDVETEHLESKTHSVSEEIVSSLCTGSTFTEAAAVSPAEPPLEIKSALFVPEKVTDYSQVYTNINTNTTATAPDISIESENKSKDNDDSDAGTKLSDDKPASLNTGEIDQLTAVNNRKLEEVYLATNSIEPEDEEVAALTNVSSQGEYVVYDGDGSKYVISDPANNHCDVTESLSIEDQMRALHGPSPEPVTPSDTTPNTSFTSVAVPDLLSLVVQETIPLRLDLATGELEPDVEAGKGLVPTQSGAWVTPRQEEVFNIISESLEVFPQDDNKHKKSLLRKSDSSKKATNVATVKPFNSSSSPKISKSTKKLSKILNSPIKLKAVMTSHPTSSSNPRPPSSVKCQCARHMVIGYPPAKVFYWTVGTTPGISSTYMDFDNQGVKFLYDQGDLKSFQAVLSSFKPEFLSTEKSLEVSLCLSCVKWAEKEYLTLKDKKREAEKSKKEKEKLVHVTKKYTESVESLKSNEAAYKFKFKCVICKQLLSSPQHFKSHVKEKHQVKASTNVESKRSSTSSKCKCLSHVDIFHGYSSMEEPPVSFRMNFSKTEENSVALRFYKEKSMLADTEPSLLCSFCVHFANQQVDRSRSKSPMKKMMANKKSSPPRKLHVRKYESSSSESSSESESDDTESSSSESEEDNAVGSCDVPGCNAVLKSPAALSSHMKSEHPEHKSGIKTQKKYKTGVIKPVRVDIKKISKEMFESLTSSPDNEADSGVTKSPLKETGESKKKPGWYYVTEVVETKSSESNKGGNTVVSPRKQKALDALKIDMVSDNRVVSKEIVSPPVNFKRKPVTEKEQEKVIPTEVAEIIPEDSQQKPLKQFSEIKLHSEKQDVIEIPSIDSEADLCKVQLNDSKPGETEAVSNKVINSSENATLNKDTINAAKDISRTEVSIKNSNGEIIDTKSEDDVPILSAKKQMALDVLKIDMVSDTVSSDNSRKGRSCKDEKSNESLETTKKSDGNPLKGSGEDLPSKKRKFENDFTQVGVVGQRRTRRSEGDSDAEKRSESTRSTNKLLLKRDVSQEIVSPPVNSKKKPGWFYVAEVVETKSSESNKDGNPVVSPRKQKALDALKIDMVSDNRDLSKEIVSPPVNSKKKPGWFYVAEVVETKSSESNKDGNPAVSARKQKALDALKIDMVSDTFSPGNKRKSRFSRDEEKDKEEEISEKVNDNLALKRRKSEENIGKAGGVGQRRTRRSEGDIDNNKCQSTRSANKLVPQPKREAPRELVTPPAKSSKKSSWYYVAEEVEVSSEKPGSKVLEKLKMNMVVDSVLPTRGKRRAEDDPNQRNPKKTKATPVDQIASKHKGFANKIFKRVRKGELTKAEGRDFLERRVPGLTHVGFGKEYSKWSRDNPVPDEDIVDESKSEEVEAVTVRPVEDNYKETTTVITVPTVSPEIGNIADKVDNENEIETEEADTIIPTGGPKKVGIKLVNVLSQHENVASNELYETYNDIIENRITVSEAAEKHSLNFSSMLNMFTNFKKKEETHVVAAIDDETKEETQSLGETENLLKLKSMKASLLEIIEGGNLNEEEKQLLKEIKELIKID